MGLAKRKFIYDKKELADPGEMFSVEEVRKYHSRQHPELVTAGYSQKFEGDVLVVTFNETVGVKG
jgi:PRTRC genetic system protein C